MRFDSAEMVLSRLQVGVSLLDGPIAYGDPAAQNVVVEADRGTR